MSGALLTDLYQLTMLQAYLDEAMHDTAVFELFVRKLPQGRNFLVAAGLEQALDYLEDLSFRGEDLAWLREQGGFSSRLIDYLKDFRFRGSVHAMAEGTVFFADEPILRITAPLPEAQLVESRLLNIIHFQTVIASKAARIVLAAPGKLLVDFGMRRAHGSEAALLAARAAYLAGFSGTATVEAGRRFGLPLFGTMAHSYVQAHASEQAAFEAFLRAWPKRSTLLVDTYDTEAAVAKAIDLAPMLAREGIALGAVRLDSGDLAVHAKLVRAMLDRADLREVTIFASGNLEEDRIAALLAAGAPLDGFGIGTALVTSNDAPALDAVYKMQSYAGLARRKRSEGKATWPGIKQVCRNFAPDGTIAGDVIQLEGEPLAGRPLLELRMQDGRRTGLTPPLGQLRADHASQLRALPPQLRGLHRLQRPRPQAQLYSCEISPGLRALAEEVDETTR